MQDLQSKVSIFEEEIQEHQNRDHVTEYKQFNQFNTTRLRVSKLSKMSSRLALSVWFELFDLSSSCNDLTDDSARVVVLGLRCNVGMTFGGILSKTVGCGEAGRSLLFLYFQFSIFGRPMMFAGVRSVLPRLGKALDHLFPSLDLVVNEM